MASADSAAPRPGRAFGALRHRDFQIFWTGAIISHIAGWMQQVAQAWLVYELTGSALLVGLNGLFSAIPFIGLSFYAGTVIDRVDRRKLLIWLELANAVVGFAMAFLVASGLIQLWQIYLIGAIHSAIGAFESPSRSAFVPHLVPRADLMTAVSLQSIQRKGTQIIGPALGGVFVAAFGVAGGYFVRAASFLVVMASVMLIKATNPVATRSREPTLRAIADGLRYVRSQPTIGALMLMEASMSVFGAYSTMMVIFAREVFDAGPEGLGLLQSAAGLGSVAGSLALSVVGDVKQKGRLLMVSGLVYSTALIAFSFTPWLWLAIPLLVLVGAVDIIFGSVRQTVIQLITRDEMLGRVMSLASVTQRGLGNVGGFQAGLLTSLLGSVQLATAIGAAVCALVLLVAGRRVPAIVDLSAAEDPRPASAPARS